MPTVVLSETPPPMSTPKISYPGAAPIGIKVAPQLERAIKLKDRAKEMISRGLKSGLSAITTDPNARVSSTAKTADLSPLSGAALRAQYSGATADRSPASTVPRSSYRRF